MPHQVTCINLSALSRLLIVELIFCLHHMPSDRVLAQDGDGLCDVPAVEPLANTSLTCHFDKDLNDTKTRFDILLTNGVKQQNAQRVVGCQWSSESISCFVSPGYKFNNKVSRQVTLEIPRASAQQIGTYRCRAGNMTINKAISCDFRVKLAGKTMCDVPSVRLNTPTSLTCYFPEDISKTETDHTVTVYHYKNSGNPDRVFRRTTNRQDIIRGYELDGNVTDHLTLRFPNAVKDQEGKYSCSITGVDLSQNCSFTLENVAPATSTCNISSVQETRPTELTCAFNVDVNVTKKNFRVVRNSGEEIVSCRWRKNELSCSKSLESEINETVTDHFVIKVTAASSEHNEKYVCQLMDTDNDCLKPCEFDVLKTAGSSGEYYTTAVVASIFIAVTAILFLIGLVIILRRRSVQQQKKRGVSTNIDKEQSEILMESKGQQ